MGAWAKWAVRARLFKREIIALTFATRDRRTPIAAKLFVLAIVAYVLSPIDLIPDFIPVLGYLDELILVPIAISFAIKMIPEPVMIEARHRATSVSSRSKRIGLVGAGLIVVLWVLLLGYVGRWFYRLVTG